MTPETRRKFRRAIISEQIGHRRYFTFVPVGLPPWRRGAAGGRPSVSAGDADPSPGGPGPRRRRSPPRCRRTFRTRERSSRRRRAARRLAAVRTLGRGAVARDGLRPETPRRTRRRSGLPPRCPRSTPGRSTNGDADRGRWRRGSSPQSVSFGSTSAPQEAQRCTGASTDARGVGSTSVPQAHRNGVPSWVSTSYWMRQLGQATSLTADLLALLEDRPTGATA